MSFWEARASDFQPQGLQVVCLPARCQESGAWVVLEEGFWWNKTNLSWWPFFFFFFFSSHWTYKFQLKAVCCCISAQLLALIFFHGRKNACWTAFCCSPFAFSVCLIVLSSALWKKKATWKLNWQQRHLCGYLYYTNTNTHKPNYLSFISHFMPVNSSGYKFNLILNLGMDPLGSHTDYFHKA